ncbi:MAG: hypothetical protein WA997_00705 [Anaerolineales bacterium]|nr:hypothetical protein [Anaerolineales bacterium]
MTVIIISIGAAWILFSALLVTIICMNSSRLNRIDEPFKDPAQLARERREKREEYAQSAMQMGAET